MCTQVRRFPCRTEYIRNERGTEQRVYIIYGSEPKSIGRVLARATRVVHTCHGSTYGLQKSPPRR